MGAAFASPVSTCWTARPSSISSRTCRTYPPIGFVAGGWRKRKPGGRPELTAAAAWLAYMIGLIAARTVYDLPSFALGAAGGAALVVLGYAAASRTRMTPASSNRARLAA